MSEKFKNLSQMSVRDGVEFTTSYWSVRRETIYGMEAIIQSKSLNYLFQATMTNYNKSNSTAGAVRFDANLPRTSTVEKLGQGHGVRHLQWRHSMANKYLSM